LAYYSVFSFGPIIVIAIAVAGLFFGHDAVLRAGHVIDKGNAWRYGRQGRRGDAGRGQPPPPPAYLPLFWVSERFSFAAIGVVVQLKDALNVVWEVEESEDSGIWHFSRNYRGCPLPRC